MLNMFLQFVLALDFSGGPLASFTICHSNVLTKREDQLALLTSEAEMTRQSPLASASRGRSRAARLAPSPGSSEAQRASASPGSSKQASKPPQRPSASGSRRLGPSLLGFSGSPHESAAATLGRPPATAVLTC